MYCPLGAFYYSIRKLDYIYVYPSNPEIKLKNLAGSLLDYADQITIKTKPASKISRFR